MALSEEAADEIEALEAMFAENFERQGEASIRLRIAPEPDDEGFGCAAVDLGVQMPEGYPASAEPVMSITVPDGDADSSEALKEGGLDALLLVAQASAKEYAGMVALFAVSEAIREWLRENARIQPKPPEPEESSDDEFDVDSEDLDDEMIEGLKELFTAYEESARLKELSKIKRLGPGPEQRKELRALLKSLPPEQLEALCGSDSEDSDEEPAPSKKGGSAAKKAEPAPVVKLPPAVIECSAGHELAAFGARPPDYKKFDGDMYTCDVCGRDGEYKYGVYHCNKCFAQGKKQYDACPSCGAGGGGGGGGGGGKKQKNKGKKR
eukprot:TRINITY_DN20834_c0_g1_i1.p1 TRINITY_DN20834_c0_g1~~TRINITY_DN20834_c0_g1_i1.p1  ORF type:complete len:344 (-),score=109.75 TRINITY_DN20834_c0_g1_i1:139-1107(-)